MDNQETRMIKRPNHLINATNTAILLYLTLLFSFDAEAGPVHVVADNEAVIRLDSTKQVIRGFGAANILPWRPDMTDDQIYTAFGTGPGQLGFSLLRLRVPHQESEFSRNVHTAAMAYSIGVEIIAAPWTPPPSMKTNNNVIGGRLLEDAYQDYADHLYYFAAYMDDNGAPLSAISVQNEPDIQVEYESCDWNAAEMLRFVKDYAPSIGVDIIVPESFNFNKTISNAILNDPEAAGNVAIIGGHLYGGGLAPYPLAEQKGKELWMTEYLDTDTTWSHVLATGKQINDCMQAGMNAYIWWYIVRFYGPILEDGAVSKRGYVMSQFSRFIRPGDIRIDATRLPQSRVYVTAYRGGSEVIIVAVNLNTVPVEQTFTLQTGSAPQWERHVTSETKDCLQEDDVTGSGSLLTVTLDAESVTTLISGDLSVTGVHDFTVPGSFALFQNFPNPFNPDTRIRYTVPGTRSVSLKILNLLGEEITTLVNGPQPPGTHEVTFDGKACPNGIYWIQLRSGNSVETKKMLLMK